MSLRLPICGLSGVIFEVDGDGSSMVLRLKQRIQAATGIPVKEQRLFAGGIELKSTSLLGNALGAVPAASAVITLVRRPGVYADWTMAFVTSRLKRAGVVKLSWPH